MSYLSVCVFVVFQSLSRVQLFATPCTAACQVPLSFTISRSLLKLKFIELIMPFNHLILCCPLFLLPSIFPNTRVFSKESVICIRWPKYWSFSFKIRPSNEYWFPLGLTGLISLLSKGLSRVFFNTTVQKHQYSLVCSLLYDATLAYVHDYWKNHCFDYTDLACKVMSLLFNTQSLS